MDPIIREIKLKQTPLRTYLKFSNYPNSFFLDSAMKYGDLGRFSFMGMEPFGILESKGRHIKADIQGWKKNFQGNPFYVLRDMLSKYYMNYRSDKFPFYSGAVGWFSYDLKQFTEHLPDTAYDDLNIPDLKVGFYDCVLIVDNLKDRAHIASTGLPETGKMRPYRAKARLEKFSEFLNGTLEEHVPSFNVGPGPVVSNFTKEDYIKTVGIAKKHIENGDIYQVNLSQRFASSFTGDFFDLYSKFRAINPAPFSAYLNFGDVKIASASPERYLKVSGDSIQTRPIKGTRPRGITPKEENALLEELISSPKDRAENVMIVDLERNDLGRICRYKTVKVTEFLVKEVFPTVFHLTSAVQGRLKENVDIADILMNCFPGGSITGAPKIRSMQIIEELEKIKRSIYTGSIGYIGFNGDMDSSIVIRTFIAKNDQLYFSAGGGIVNESDPLREYDETLHKAKALFDALGQKNTGKIKNEK